MGRQLNDVVLPTGRSLLGYYSSGYYNNGYSCADRAGCLAGSIIGATVFFIIALLLVACLIVRIRRQRAAALAQPQYYPDPNQGGQTGPPPMQYTGSGATQYPAPSAWGPGGPTQQHQDGGSSAVPTNFANDAQRNQWEREQYEKYGEAGLVQGQPVDNMGNGVQMAQYPPKQ